MVTVCPFHFKILPKVKLDQAEVSSHIYQNHCIASRKPHQAIICPNLNEELTKRVFMSG